MSRAPAGCAIDPAADDATVQGELLDDGQEEVFAYSAIDCGIVRDPPALGPVGARRPCTPSASPETGPGPEPD